MTNSSPFVQDPSRLGIWTSRIPGNPSIPGNPEIHVYPSLPQTFTHFPRVLVSPSNTQNYLLYAFNFAPILPCLAHSLLVLFHTALPILRFTIMRHDYALIYFNCGISFHCMNVLYPFSSDGNLSCSQCFAILNNMSANIPNVSCILENFLGNIYRRGTAKS